MRSKVLGKSIIFSSLKIGGGVQSDFEKIETKDRCFGKIRTKDREMGEGGKAIFSELKIADFPETLDHTPKCECTCL